ncbi:Glutamate decarboxylase 2 [Batrachochytrium dendrobatidis]|nr:Glutamate decarboxylase 2 [Batrachochytrium dendrobatidis]KAK5667091.1 Glutamate decarboxylase 2 [Batrachochytrium dendrobatidis]
MQTTAHISTAEASLHINHKDTDEGFEDDYPEEFPFWYSFPSGEQHIDRHQQKLLFESSSASKAVFPLDLFLKQRSSVDLRIRNDSTVAFDDNHQSFHNQDSVLHYFVPTTKSEKLLDQYISGVIEAFLDEPAPIYATAVSRTHSLTGKFGGLSIPDGNRSSVADLESYLNHLKLNVIDKSTRTGSSKMIGHMTTALPFFHRPLARLLAALNQNVVKIETASTFTNLERQTLAMLHKAFFGSSDEFYTRYAYAPEYALGVMASGGTIANITALWIARNKALAVNAANGCCGIDKEGYISAMLKYGYKRAVIIGSTLMHYSFKKAADLLGLGEEGLVLIPVDDAFRMRIDVLKAKVEKCVAENTLVIAIVGISGTTETGSIDPLLDIACIAHKYHIHFHVDAAWGGPLIFSPEHSSKLAGISQADTITVDGHKQLYTPMGLGILLAKCPSLVTFIRKTAGYVIRHDSPDLGKFTLEGSRPANVLYLHASLNLLGKQGLGTLMTRSVTVVKQMAVRLNLHPSQSFQTLHEPMSNVLLYRYIPSDLRESIADGTYVPNPEDEDRVSEVTKRLQIYQASCIPSDAVFPEVSTHATDESTNGEAGLHSQQNQLQGGFVSRTRVLFKGFHVNALRVVVANPLTTWRDVEGVISDQLKMGAMIEEEMKREQMVKRVRDMYPMHRPNAVVPDSAKSCTALAACDGTDTCKPDDKIEWWPGWPFDL